MSLPNDNDVDVITRQTNLVHGQLNNRIYFIFTGTLESVEESMNHRCPQHCTPVAH